MQIKMKMLVYFVILRLNAYMHICVVHIEQRFGWLVGYAVCQSLIDYFMTKSINN